MGRWARGLFVGKDRGGLRMYPPVQCAKYLSILLLNTNLNFFKIQEAFGGYLVDASHDSLHNNTYVCTQAPLGQIKCE